MVDDDGDEQNQREGNLPSPPMEIEGIVRGEPDSGIVQSGGNASQDEAEASEEVDQVEDNEGIDEPAEVLTIYFLLTLYS